MKNINKKNGPQRSIFYLLLITAIGLIANGGYIFAKAQLAQYLISDAWDKTLSGNTQVKPWSWADTWPVAKLQFQNKAVSFYVLNGANGASLPFGPGHLTGSAFPGDSGSSIIAGHRDTHFELLQHIDLDEKIKIQTREGYIVWYQVNSIHIADSRKQTLEVTENSEKLILVTCYPFDAINPGGPLRYVVTAKRIN
ncbi:MAG: class GN sortase [gamma proteobacterium symbiont of Bathyaustriella thionipta]|nr:class GN sortase [gamma proteobacterium symbiont of Bathyaustriella thionipta]MCU7953309.1 class GN sortase [gamma proteobacterium symbiont of Bathyaustriella thionipta]